MARRAAANCRTEGVGQYVKLEARLLLLAWLKDLFG